MPPTFPEKSIVAVHYNRCTTYAKKTALYGPWKEGARVNYFVPQIYEETLLATELIASGLMALGLKPGDRVALASENCIRWVNAFEGILIAGGIVTTVYPTLTDHETAVILKDSGARFVFCGTAEIMRKIAGIRHSLPELERMIVFEPYAESDANVLSFDRLVELGQEKLDRPTLYRSVESAQLDDLAVLIYTSGTTGEPKGAMLTNGNFLAERPINKIFKMNENDIWLSHLPLCHVFGLTGDLLGCGECGGILAMSPGLGSEDMRFALTNVRPTLLLSVPRLYEKMYLKVQSTLAEKPAFARKILNWALGVGREMFKYTSCGKQPPSKLLFQHRVADRVLAKVRKQSGFDRLRVAYAGGGPISPSLVLFFQGLGIDIYQGYGLTETSPVVTVNRPGSNKLGSVGPAIEGAEFQIAEDGEILVRGPMLMKGYWKKPEATAEAIDAGGWFHTGDIGFIDEDRHLHITDRKKEILVTSGGKNIAPTRIEALFNTEPMIEMVAVIGNSRKFLSALVCPNFEALEPWAKEQGLTYHSWGELVRLPQVIALYQQSVDKINAQLARFETIKKFAVMDHVFSQDTGELTATQKIKRRVVDEMYNETINGFYQD